MIETARDAGRLAKWCGAGQSGRGYPRSGDV